MIDVQPYEVGVAHNTSATSSFKRSNTALSAFIFRSDTICFSIALISTRRTVFGWQSFTAEFKFNSAQYTCAQFSRHSGTTLKASPPQHGAAAGHPYTNTVLRGGVKITRHERFRSIDGQRHPLLRPERHHVGLEVVAVLSREENLDLHSVQELRGVERTDKEF